MTTGRCVPPQQRTPRVRAESGAPLTAVCPAPVTLSDGAAGTSVTRTIIATDRGAATATVSVDIDRVRPAVRVTKVRAGAPHFAPGPVVGCRATDRHSGVVTCKVTRRTKGNRIVYRAGRPTGPATPAAPAWSLGRPTCSSVGRPCRRDTSCPPWPYLHGAGEGRDASHLCLRLEHPPSDRPRRRPVQAHRQEHLGARGELRARDAAHRLVEHRHSRRHPHPRHGRPPLSRLGAGQGRSCVVAKQ